MKKPSESLLEAVALTAELCGRTFSEGAARMFVADLAPYPENQVLAALQRCRREVRGALTVADVVSRLDDGRPGVEEAWAMLPRDEATTVVWTQEMQSAWGVALPLLGDRNETAARMAFKEAYVAAVATARANAVPVTWVPSLGHDPHLRERALLEAVQKGRLSGAYVQKLLPYRDFSKAVAIELFKSNAA